LQLSFEKWLDDYFMFFIELDCHKFFGGISLLGDNVNGIIWLYDDINVIIRLDANILLFNRSYDWAGIILDVPSERMTPLMLLSGWRIKLML
jgi:hypothetical protein